MATHSIILAWKIPWTEEPGALQSMRSQSWTRLSTHAHTWKHMFVYIHWYACLCMYLCVCVYTHIYACVHTYVWSVMSNSVTYIYIYNFLCVCVYIYPSSHLWKGIWIHFQLGSQNRWDYRKTLGVLKGHYVYFERIGQVD